jgi:hypothetical protein
LSQLGVDHGTAAACRRWLARDRDRAALGGRRPGLGALEATSRGGVLGRTQRDGLGLRLGSLILGRAHEAPAFAVPALGGLDLLLPLEQNRLPTHFVVIPPQCAGTG